MDCVGIAVPGCHPDRDRHVPLPAQQADSGLTLNRNGDVARLSYWFINLISQ